MVDHHAAIREMKKKSKPNPAPGAPRPTPKQINDIVGLAQINVPIGTICKALLIKENDLEDWLALGRDGKDPQLQAFATSYDQASALYEISLRQVLQRAATQKDDTKIAESLLKDHERAKRDASNPALIKTVGPLENPQHELFAQAIARGATQCAAYQGAYPKTTVPSARANGGRLITNAKVKARVEELQARSANKTVLSIAERRELASEISRTHHLDPQVSAVRLRAIELEAKLAGEFLERQDLTSNGEALPAALPPIVITPPGGTYKRRGQG